MEERKTLVCIMKKLKKTWKTTKVFHQTVQFLSFLDYWIQWTAYTLSGFFCSFAATYFSYICLSEQKPP